MSDVNRSNFRLDTDLVSLRALVAIADTGSFSKAAERIGRTQSAVSLQINKLEERLGTQLLNRTSRKVTQTQAGETLIAYARRILALADEASIALSAPETEQPFRLGFAEYMAPDHLHDLLGRFRRAHPKLAFEVRLGTGLTLRNAMDAGELDVMVAGPDGRADTHDNPIVLLSEDMVWVGEDHIVAECGAGALPLVLMQPPCSYRRHATEALDRMGRSWMVSAEVNSIHAVRSSIKAGLGISAVARSGASGLPRLDGQLPPLPQTAMIAYRGGDGHPLTDRFITFLSETVGQTLGGQLQ